MWYGGGRPNFLLVVPVLYVTLTTESHGTIVTYPTITNFLFIFVPCSPYSQTLSHQVFVIYLYARHMVTIQDTGNTDKNGTQSYVFRESETRGADKTS